MKNIKIYLLIVLLAIALITGGIIISITPSKNTNKKEQQPTETRKYKTKWAKNTFFKENQT